MATNVTAGTRGILYFPFFSFLFFFFFKYNLPFSLNFQTSLIYVIIIIICPNK